MLFLVILTGRDPTASRSAFSSVAIPQRAGAAIQFRNYRLDFFQHLALGDTAGEFAQPCSFGAEFIRGLHRGPVHHWTSIGPVGRGISPGLFNALFFGGMGRVSLKCHTPTQTAL